MKKSRAKLSLLLLLFAVMLTACLALAACAQSAYKIRLERTSVTLEKGEQLLLEYSVTKSGEPYEADGVTVEVAGDAVAYDNATNKITAVKAGKAEVALSFKGASAKLSVTVPRTCISRAPSAITQAPQSPPVQSLSSFSAASSACTFKCSAQA